MEKSIYNTNENGLSYGRGYVYSLQYHIVWCTKYRRKVLTAGTDEDCKQLLLDLAEENSFRIPAMEVMPDHVHVLIDAKPQFYISDMVKIMKGTLARRLFLLHPEMKEKLWGGHLWNPSYCVVTVSDRSRWRNISGARRKRPGAGRDVRRGIWKGSRDTTGKYSMQIMPCPGAEMPENSSSLKTTVTYPHDCGHVPCSGKDNSRKSDYPVSVLPHLHRRCP